jgi:thioredoxin-like negative regulator of GroEL
MPDEGPATTSAGAAAAAPDAPVLDLADQAAVEAVMAAGAGPAVIDFWSSTCGPCRAMAPQFAAVAAHHQAAELPEGAPRVRFYKLQTDAVPELAAAFSIRAVPTLLFVHDGEIVDGAVGYMDGRALAKKVEWLQRKAQGGGLWSALTGLFGGRKREPPPAS